MKTGKRTFAEVAEVRLAADILAGRLVPGRRLRLSDMMNTYGVGMSPLREALARLSGHGPVEATVARKSEVAATLLEDHIEEVKIEMLRLAGPRLFPELSAQTNDPFEHGPWLEGRLTGTAP